MGSVSSSQHRDHLNTATPASLASSTGATRSLSPLIPPLLFGAETPLMSVRSTTPPPPPPPPESIASGACNLLQAVYAQLDQRSQALQGIVVQLVADRQLSDSQKLKRLDLLCLQYQLCISAAALTRTRILLCHEVYIKLRPNLFDVSAGFLYQQPLSLWATKASRCKRRHRPSHRLCSVHLATMVAVSRSKRSTSATLAMLRCKCHLLCPASLPPPFNPRHVTVFLALFAHRYAFMIALASVLVVMFLINRILSFSFYS